MKHKPQGSRKKSRYAQLRSWLDLPGNGKKTYAEYERSKEYRMAHDDWKEIIVDASEPYITKRR